jgi:hypothetical protein
MWRATADYPNDGVPALASAYRIGSVVAQQRVDNVAQYQQTLPGE